MANERDFELLDDYLTNRLSEQDRSAFEQRLNADPDLQNEYALQKRMIQGIKDARVAQLKSMLNQVPVPSASGGNAIATKVILGTLVTLMIAAAAFWYYRDEPIKVEQATAPSSQQAQPQTTPTEQPAISETKPETKTSQQSVVKDRQVQETDKNQTSAGTEHSKPSLARKPDPLSAPAAPNSASESTTGADEATVAVVINNSNTTYTFHYKLGNDKLELYGPFEKGSYKITEVSEGGTITRALFYKDKYYSLDDTGNEIRPLSQVTDASLLTRLEEQRRLQ